MAQSSYYTDQQRKRNQAALSAAARTSKLDLCLKTVDTLHLCTRSTYPKPYPDTRMSFALICGHEKEANHKNH
ncbi:hypothetical protein MXMO3_00925 [Maritalea myrionectae]|uniref:Uncharacterized protein n=1 Tax=Maritalea myrionectae TaxID=454601 RepID=A0A2R4MC32_9HYPH|nr:hypothetical protein MXMO3_00925 [Maritalea myrionectae]